MPEQSNSDFIKLWKKFAYKSITAILSKRIENYITFTTFQKQIQPLSNEKKLGLKQIAGYYWRYLEGTSQVDIENMIQSGIHSDCEDVIADKVLQQENSYSLVSIFKLFIIKWPYILFGIITNSFFKFLGVPNFNSQLERILPLVGDKIILEIYTTVEVEQFKGKKIEEEINLKGGALANQISRDNVSETKFKDILLERWEVSYSSPVSEKADLGIAFKKCVITLRSLYGYALLLPAFKMYENRMTFKNTQNEIKFKLLTSEQNLTLSFEQSETSKHDFDKIQTKFGDISLKVQYLRDLSKIPLPKQKTSEGLQVKDEFLISNQSPSIPTRQRTKSFPANYIGHAVNNPIDIKKKSDPGSPNSKSQPRDIPMTRERSNTNRGLSYNARFEETPPFGIDRQSYESPIFGSMGVTPPFHDIYQRNRSISNSSSKSRPNLGNIAPYDSPSLHYLSGSNRSSFRNRDSLGNSSLSKNQTFSFEENRLSDSIIGSLPRNDEDEAYGLINTIGKNKEIEKDPLQTFFLKDHQEDDVYTLKQNGSEEDFPFAPEESDDEDDISRNLFNYFHNPPTLHSLNQSKILLRDMNTSFENVKTKMRR